MCAPWPKERRSFDGSMPPTAVTIRAPASRQSQVSSRLTWSASSRVGATITASGAPGRGSSPPGISSAAIARPKATVLPDPVRAETSRSRPTAPSSSTAAWTGVGVS